jgi:hypothetical protein
MKRKSNLLRIVLASIPMWTLPATSFAATAFAAPSATWVTQWVVTLNGKNEAGNATDMRAFGGGTDGQTINLGVIGQPLPGTSAVAQSSSSVTSSVFSDSVAQTGLTFTRFFSLEGSPGGWNVTLSSLLTGTLSADGAAYSPFANVMALVDVVGVAALVEPYGVSASATATADPVTVGVSIPQSLSTNLPDGLYEVSGELLTTAQVKEGGLLSGGSASSDFFNTFVASVDATPNAVPEPATFGTITLGAGLLVMGAWRRRHQ